MVMDAKKASKEDIARGLELLERENVRKEKIARGEIKGHKPWGELSDAEKNKVRHTNKIRNTRIKLKCDRFDQAVAAGNMNAVTDDEVAAAIAMIT